MANDKKNLGIIAVDQAKKGSYSKQLTNLKEKRLLDKPNKTAPLKERIDWIYTYMRLE